MRDILTAGFEVIEDSVFRTEVRDGDTVALFYRAQRQGRRGLAAFPRLNTAPLQAMVAFGDRRVVPLAAPPRRTDPADR